MLTRTGSVRDVRAVALLSGGLDSVLAARLLTDQGVEVVGLSFESPFFGARKAREAAAEIGVDLVVVDIGDELLRIAASPKHGYGKHVNPCIDCHALMVRRAAEMMEELGASFIVTGEVVGQRPKSQMRFGLEAVERESGVGGLLVRPLSAKLLSPTIPEEQGWIDRSRLLALHGRTRKPQMELARRFGITRYASPAGGCLLTDANYARGFRDLAAHGELSIPALRLLSVGRQFRLPGGAKLAVGRNHAENEALAGLAPPAARLVRVIDRRGPLGVLDGDASEGDVLIAAGIVARYADTPEGDPVRVQVRDEGGTQQAVEVVPLDDEKVKEFSV
jgi:tRNA-specific 2-thiouridylase